MDINDQESGLPKYLCDPRFVSYFFSLTHCIWKIESKETDPEDLQHIECTANDGHSVSVDSLCLFLARALPLSFAGNFG